MLVTAGKVATAGPVTIAESNNCHTAVNVFLILPFITVMNAYQSIMATTLLVMMIVSVAILEHTAIHIPSDNANNQQLEVQFARTLAHSLHAYSLLLVRLILLSIHQLVHQQILLQILLLILQLILQVMSHQCRFEHIQLKQCSIIILNLFSFNLFLFGHSRSFIILRLLIYRV